MPDLIEQFAASYHAYHRISPDRRQVQLRLLRAFEDSVDGAITDADGPDLQSFLGSLIDAGRAPGTVGKARGALLPFFTWLWQQRKIDADQLMRLRDVPAPRGHNNGKPRPYTRREIAKFWQQFDVAYPPQTNIENRLTMWGKGRIRFGRVKPIFDRAQTEAIACLAVYGGIRRNEIFDLTVERLEPRADYISVLGAAKNRDARRDERAVPWLTPHLHTSVERWLVLRSLFDADHETAWLSLHYKHAPKPLRHQKFKLLLTHLGTGWEFHRMRHTAATEMLRAGMPLEQVSRILGHAKLEQTMRYAYVANADLVLGAHAVEKQLAKALGR